MKSDGHNVDHLVSELNSNPSNLDALLTTYRPYLRVLADNDLHDGMRRRCDASDIVQDTLAEVAKHIENFNGASEEEFSEWVLRIHRHSCENAKRRHHDTLKRTVDLEQSVGWPDDEVSLCWLDISDDGSSPSKRYVRGEKALLLARILSSLPERQYHAVRMKFLEGMRVKEITKELETTREAVGGLIKRGLRTLRERMNPDSWSS